MADGIHPASANRNPNGTTVPTKPDGQTFNVAKSARGKLTAAATNVDTASNSNTNLTETSSPLNRLRQRRSTPGAITSAPNTGKDQSSPKVNPTKYAVNITIAD